MQVNSYETAAGKRYAVVMISNTGADAKGWYWYVGASPSDISTHLSANNARLIDIDYDEASTAYNAIMVELLRRLPGLVVVLRSLSVSDVLPALLNRMERG